MVHNNSHDNIAANKEPVLADAWELNTADRKPSQFKLPVREIDAVKAVRKGNSVFLDFGKETFGFIRIKDLK